MNLLASSRKTETKHCLLAFHVASIKYLLASNDYCFVAHYTFPCNTSVTHWLLSNDSWFIWLFLLIRYICHVKMQLNDVIKNIGLYWAFVVSLIPTNIAKNRTDIDISISIGTSLVVRNNISNKIRVEVTR